MTEGQIIVDVEVTTIPLVSVMRKVTKEGAGETVGMAVTLLRFEVPKRGTYVLVASPEKTTSPADAGIEVLKA